MFLLFFIRQIATMGMCFFKKRFQSSIVSFFISFKYYRPVAFLFFNFIVSREFQQNPKDSGREILVKASREGGGRTGLENYTRTRPSINFFFLARDSRLCPLSSTTRKRREKKSCFFLSLLPHISEQGNSSTVLELLIDLFVALVCGGFPFPLVWSNMEEKKGSRSSPIPHVILFATPSPPPEEIKMFRRTCVCVCFTRLTRGY
jgi:hypothetical protein